MLPTDGGLDVHAFKPCKGYLSLALAQSSSYCYRNCRLLLLTHNCPILRRTVRNRLFEAGILIFVCRAAPEPLHLPDEAVENGPVY